MCQSHACGSKMSVFWMYEMTASTSDGTGLPKHATLYTHVGVEACLCILIVVLSKY